ncbi:MAG: ABC transporter substrate-binding protein [Hyphomicrobiaceae bacterium]
MRNRVNRGAAALGVAACLMAPMAAVAQKSGGILRTYNSSNPPSASIIEEATIATVFAFSPIFNNLVIYDQAEPINRPEVIRPELAESWAWDAANTRLTMKLRQGVKWHDGKPFTSSDVKCTWDRILGKDTDTFRKNPRKLWWQVIKDIETKGDHEVTFVLERPQAAFLSLLASNMSPVYPCHVPTRDMRTRPIGTGPFKFVAFEANNVIRLERNKEYWREGRPYLDGIDIRIIGNRSTRLLAFSANEFDITFVADVTAPLVGDVMSRSPQATCQLVPTGVSTNLLVNREKPPFDNPKLREAMTLALDRDAMVKIVTAGKASISGAMMAEPEGNWGMPPARLAQFPQYAGTGEARREKARAIMKELGYGPEKRLKVKVGTRDFQAFKDPAVLLVDQLNQIYFDAELEIIESTLYYGRVARGDYAVVLNLTGAGVDDPDVTMVEGYSCKSERNYTKYCNAEVDALIDAQSREIDAAKRKELVWRIEKILIEDAARPIIFHGYAGTCWHPHLKGHVLHRNSIYNNWRFENVWLDK